MLRMGIPVAPRNIFPSNIQGLPTWYEVRISEAGHLGARGGTDLMPELGYRPVNKYLPPRRGRMAPAPLTALAEAAGADGDGGNRLLSWVDRLLSR